MDEMVICGTKFRRQDILALLRRDAAFLHSDITDEEIFALALRDHALPKIPENYRELGIIDLCRFWSDYSVPHYIPLAVERAMAVGK